MLNFLVCDTNLCQYGEGCGEYALLANASCVRTEAQIDARTEAQNEIAQRLSNLKPLLTEAEKLFSEMDASMPLREEMPSPEPVHLSLSKMMAELETRSTIARNLAGSSSIGASVDIVIVRCDEEVSPWLPRLVSHFPHDVKVKVVLGEMCQDMCVFQAGVVGSGKAPPIATGGLIEACENPRQEEVLGAKVEHRKFANVGFESAAYIKYIIDNYKTEALDSTLFLQAGWPEHSAVTGLRCTGATCDHESFRYTEAFMRRFRRKGARTGASPRPSGSTYFRNGELDLPITARSGTSGSACSTPSVQSLKNAHSSRGSLSIAR